MQRPEIDDPKVLKYVQYLEKLAENIDIESIKAESYVAITETIKSFNEILLGEHEVMDPSDPDRMVKTQLFSWTSFSDKDDKVIDRAKVFIGELPTWIEKAEKLKEGIELEVIEKVEVKYKNKEFV